MQFQGSDVNFVQTLTNYLYLKKIKKCVLGKVHLVIILVAMVYEPSYHAQEITASLAIYRLLSSTHLRNDC